MKGKIFTPTLIMLGLMSVYGSAEAGAVNDDFQQAFINDSKLSLNSALYVRQRAVKDLKTGSYSADGSQGGIENQTANISIDYKGGYYKDVIGLDFMAASNIKLGQSVGQSEILLYDYDCKGDGTLNPCEKSYAAIPIAALKAKYGNDNFLFNITGGYTTINSGTIKNSWGLNPHSYRGLDTSLALSKVKLTYAWADQFRNDWTDSFHDMTNTWHQNEAANLSGVKPGAIINHIQSAGLVYDADGTVYDLAYGEGEGYRKNWHLLMTDNHKFDNGAVLTSTGYYQGGKYLEEKSNVKDPSLEYYVAAGLSLAKDNVTYFTGYSQNKSESTKDYNFRLTPWANSDKRDFQQTLSSLEDYNVAGAKAVKVGIKYNMLDFGLPNLTLGTSANYAWHVVSDVSKVKEQRTYDGTMQSWDFLINYKFNVGAVKDVNMTVLPALFRSKDTNAKQDRNDIRIIFTHSLNLLN